MFTIKMDVKQITGQKILSCLITILAILSIIAPNTSYSHSTVPEALRKDGLPEGKWKITAYDSCYKCTGKHINNKYYGITASGKVARHGMVACNWLPFGTKLRINGLEGIYVVEDRGAKSLFGSKSNPIKHLDIYMDCHTKALKFGVKHLEVEVIK